MLAINYRLISSIWLGRCVGPMVLREMSMTEHNAVTLERLKEFLKDLAPDGQIQLLLELERTMLRGEEGAGVGFLAHELRGSIRHSGRRGDRVGNPSRLFFQPIQQLLVNGSPMRKRRGHIARGSLGPIWDWICHDLMPVEAEAYMEAAKKALLHDDKDAARRIADAFRIEVVKRIRKKLSVLGGEADARYHLAARMGSPRAVDDLQQMIGFFGAAERLPVSNEIDARHVRAPCMMVVVQEFWRILVKDIFSSYRPERYYMRGPGPKWAEKHRDSVAIGPLHTNISA